MKTIQIPLELAEEILRVTDYMTDSANIFMPDYYHKLKKLVDEQTQPRIKRRYKDLAHLDKETTSMKGIAALNNIYNIEAFVETTGETYRFVDGEWVVDLCTP